MENKGEKKSKSKSKSNSNSTSDEKIDVKLNKNIIGETKKVKSKESNITFIVVEKNGDLKEYDIKENIICPEELSKKCKFKKVDGFIKRTEWNYSSKSVDESSSTKVIVELWAKNDGLANHENKYEFPPPVDNELFFGGCALVARDNKNNYVNLTKDKWDKIYEHLFGGFESLVANEDEDEDEEDELESIPKNRKTRDGYLKDGFVVDGGAGCESDVDVAGNADDHESDEDEDDSDTDTDSDNSSDDGSNDGDGCVDGEEGVEDGYFNKKTRNIVTKNVLSKSKPKVKTSIVDNTGDKNMLKDDDDNENSGWKTDESSELSEDEYSYSK
jgi:hypothetical protein